MFAEKEAKFRELVPKLAAELGFRVDDSLNYDWARRIVYAGLDNTLGGLKLFVSLDGHKGRVKVSPSVPNDGNTSMNLRSWGVIPYGESDPTAGFALDRDPVAVAKEVKRKVLDPYAALYPLVLSKIEENAARRNSSANTAAAIARTFKTDVRSWGGALRVYGGETGERAEFEINEAGGAVRVNLSLPHDKAKALAEYLAA